MVLRFNAGETTTLICASLGEGREGETVALNAHRVRYRVMGIESMLVQRIVESASAFTQRRAERG
jgi:hypothetical protein